jgi:hypothetical protein
MTWVIVNTERTPVGDSHPDAGNVYLFLTTSRRVAAGWTDRQARTYGGLRLPAFVARLFGYRVEQLS